MARLTKQQRKLVADKDFDKHIFNWRRLTIDVVSELWVFYKKLAKPGKRTDLGANAPGWQEWLDSKGICKDTPLRHFKSLGWIVIISGIKSTTATRL